MPVVFMCALLGMSLSWFCKWTEDADRPGAQRGLFTLGCCAGTCSTVPWGSRSRRRGACTACRGWWLTCALRGEPRVRRRSQPRCVARADRTKDQAPQRVAGPGQDQGAVPGPARAGLHRPGAGPRRVGDATKTPTATGKLYLATMISLFSRRQLGAATSLHPNTELLMGALTMTVTVR